MDVCSYLSVVCGIMVIPDVVKSETSDFLPVDGCEVLLMWLKIVNSSLMLVDGGEVLPDVGKGGEDRNG